MNKTKRQTILTPEGIMEVLGSLILQQASWQERTALAQETVPFPSMQFPVTKYIPPDRLAALAETMFHVRLQTAYETLGHWADEIAQSFSQQSRPAVTFHTSGSTGTPKAVTSPLELMEQELDSLQELFSGRSRVISCAPCHHLYGFTFAVLLPARLGIQRVCLPAPPTENFFTRLQRGDLVAGFPLFWKKLTEKSITLPRGIHGLTATAPCPAETIHAARAMGLECITEIYGTTESGAIGYRQRPEDPYTLLPHWTVQDSETLSRKVPSQNTSLSCPLQDTIDWCGPGQFRPTGRKDKAVQVAGINVYPEQVRRILLQHPHILDCAVRPMRPEQGNRLKAFVVFENSEKNLSGVALRRWLKGKLDDVAVPGLWTCGTALPINATGKLQDW